MHGSSTNNGLSQHNGLPGSGICLAPVPEIWNGWNDPKAGIQ